MKRLSWIFKRCLLVFSASLSLFLHAGAADLITGAGSSFIAPVLYKWSFDYYEQNKVKINYQSTGSGAGLKQVEGKIVDFGASDKPLSVEELEEKGLFQFPAIMGGIVLVTNIPGISQGQLILDGPTIAQIYSGRIKKWDDENLAALNPHLKLPHKNITVVYRSDASGTTFNFTSFLEKSSQGNWKAGSGTAISWPSGATGVGAKGNEGITTMIKRASGSLGYVEYAYALQNKLAWTRLKNSRFQVVPQLDPADFQQPQKVSAAFRKAFRAAALSPQWDKLAGFSVLLTHHASGDFAWPLTAATFILMHKNQPDQKVAQEVLKFFHFAFTKGEKSAQALDYIPIPQKTYEFIQKKWTTEIKCNDGSPLWRKEPF
jgi:phosphate transport system substrate-binding protein